MVPSRDRTRDPWICSQTRRPMLMYMYVSAAECMNPIYHFDTLFGTIMTFIFICYLHFTHIACEYDLKAFQL